MKFRSFLIISNACVMLFCSFGSADCIDDSEQIQAHLNKARLNVVRGTGIAVLGWDIAAISMGSLAAPVAAATAPFVGGWIVKEGEAHENEMVVNILSEARRYQSSAPYSLPRLAALTNEFYEYLNELRELDHLGLPLGLPKSSPRIRSGAEAAFCGLHFESCENNVLKLSPSGMLEATQSAGSRHLVFRSHPRLAQQVANAVNEINRNFPGCKQGILPSFDIIVNGINDLLDFQTL